MCSTDGSVKLTDEGYLIRYFEWNKQIFEVVNAPCNLDDTKKLITAIISQAVKDFERLAAPVQRKRKADTENWHSACGLLFDDDYLIQYGDTELNFAEMLVIIGSGDGFSVPSLRKSLIAKTTQLWKAQGEILEDEFYRPNLGSL